MVLYRFGLCLREQAEQERAPICRERCGWYPVPTR